MSLQNAPILAPGSTMALNMPVANYVAPQGDYQLKSADKPVYQYVQQFANNVGSSVTINATSTSQAIFNLSGDVCWNFNRSYITYQLSATASTNLASLSVDTVPIDNIALQTVGGTQIAQIFNFCPYSRVVPALTTDLQEYLSRGYVTSDTFGGASALPTTAFWNSQYTECRYLQPHNQLFSTAAVSTPAQGSIATSTAIQIPSAQYVYGSVASPSICQGSALTYAVDSGVDKSYYGRQHMIYAPTAIASGADAAHASTSSLLRVLCCIPFKVFVGTMLAVDKDILIGSNLQLVINFASANNFIWDTSTYPVTGAQTVISYAGQVTLNNLYLWMAKQCQSNLVNKLRDMLRTGYEIMIPFTYCGKNSTSSTGLYSAPQTLSTGMGESLLRIVNIVCNGTSNPGLINDMDNVNGHKYTTVQSFLDANPLQYTQLQCGTNIQDWQYMRNLLKGTPLGMSVREFQKTSCFIDNFASSLESGTQILENDCIDSGLKLGEASKNYILQVTLASGGSGCNLYQYMTWLRRLVIAPNGLHWA